MEYYSAVKTVEVLIQVTTQVNLEVIVGSERSQSPDLILWDCVLYEMSTIGKTIESENRLAGPVGSAGSEDRLLDGTSFRELEWWCRALRMCQMPLPCTLQKGEFMGCE